MGKKVQTTKICVECQNPFKVSYFSEASICRKCIAIQKSTNIEKTAKDLKEGIVEYSESIEFDLSDPQQKLAAVRIQGELFSSKPGGLQLMSTEFVENGMDAIKKKKTLRALPIATKQLGFSDELKKLAYQKYQLPKNEFENILKSISNESKHQLEKLNELIPNIVKSKLSEKEKIVVELDEDKSELVITDSGTGVEFPRHICSKPFVSLKTGEDYSTGQFGRGAQVFRAFTNNMEFYSLREDLSEKEKEVFKKKGVDYSKIDGGKAIRLIFPEDKPGGIYSLIRKNQFKELSSNQTGTVVIIKDWKERYFEQLVKKIKKLKRRLEHHFGFEVLDGIYNISLVLRTNKKNIEIFPKGYDHPKIQGKFEFEPILLKDQEGNPYGEIVFHLFKTNRSYADDFKKPFLVVRGRPLGDSFVSDIPELEYYSDVWSSNFLTGYVVCDCVKPNQSRLGLDSTPSKQPFMSAMLAASIDLKKELSLWKTQLSGAEDKTLGNEVALEVSKFLKSKGVKFNFKNPIQKGLQNKLNQSGGIMDNERISSVPDGKNQGRIVAESDDIIDILYKPETREPRPPEPPGPENPDDERIKVTVTTPKKDGKKTHTVYIKRTLVSKGGRKIKRSFSGPGIDYDANEDDEMELSFYEPDPPTVMINREHKAWKKLSKKASDQSDTNKLNSKKKKYMMERYMWELLNNCLENRKELSEEAIDNMFWTYFHELSDFKE